MTEKEVRNDLNPHRIRFFEKSSMVEFNERFDLLKIKCTQPYTSRWQFGISFITIYTSDEIKEEKLKVTSPKIPQKVKEEKKSSPPSKDPKKLIGKFAFRDSSSDDDNESSPFKQWKDKKAFAPQNRKRIRSSSSSSDEKEKKKPLIKSRNRSHGLMYESDDDEPNERLQKKINLDKKEEKKEVKIEVKTPTNKFASFISNDTPATSSLKKETSSKTSQKMSTPKKDSQNKLKDSPAPSKKTQKNQLYKPFNKLLEDVTFVISGYQNPERGILRQKAIDLGARYKADWDGSCTHLM